LELKSDPDIELEGMIIESKLDRRRGVVVACVIRSGTLSLGNIVSASGYKAKVKSMMDDKGDVLKTAYPSTPVEILGFKKVPNVGDLLVEAGSELTELAVDEHRIEIIGQDTKNTIAVVVRADTQGTLEAVKASLSNLVASSVGSTFSLKFLLCSTGDITDSDVLLAQSAKGIIIGFNVRVAPKVLDLAQNLKVQVRSYKTIYDLVDEAKDLLEGTAFEEEEKIKGRARVLKRFKLPSGDIVAGVRVLAGVLKEGSRVEIYDKDPADLSEDDAPLYVGRIKTLKKGRETTKLVGKDNECGILLKPIFEDIKKDLFVEVK
jgi:translation initiation factor IF-2